MRKIDTIIIHCSATKRGADFSAADIDRWHRQRGFQGIGYHFVVRLDGTVESGREIARTGAHCLGWNGRSIGICYIGGVNEQGEPEDTRTPAQSKALRELVERLRQQYPIRQVIGHRDVSPDCNGNGHIESGEYIKACPSFDVKEWMKSGMALLLLLALSASCGSHRKIATQQESLHRERDSKQETLQQQQTEECSAMEQEEASVEAYSEESIWVVPIDSTMNMQRGAIIKRKHVFFKKERQAKEEASHNLIHEETRKDSVTLTQTHRQEESSKSVRKNRPQWLWGLIPLIVGAVLFRWLRQKRNREAL